MLDNNNCNNLTVEKITIRACKQSSSNTFKNAYKLSNYKSYVYPFKCMQIND